MRRCASSRRRRGGSPAALAVIAVLASVFVAGCSQKSTHDAVVPQAPVTISPCPIVTTGPHTWPAGTPSDLPWPITGKQGTITTNDGLNFIRFSSSQALRDELLPMLKALRNNGYAIGRGDAEANEADIPFAKGSLHGLYKMVRIEQCHTEWVLAVGQSSQGGTGPTAPSFSPHPSAAPLPF